MITAGSELVDPLLLDGLAPEDQSRLASLFTRLEYPSGADIIRQGEPCESLFIVESGSVLVHSSQQGKLAHRGPGECLGELSMVTAGPASATATAVTDVVVQAVSQTLMRPLLEGVPVLARNFCRLLGRRLVASSRMSERSPLTLLGGAGDGVQFGFVSNLAVSLAHHLQEEVALVDLSGPIEGSGTGAAPRFEPPRRRLTLVRSGGLAPDQLPRLVDALTRQYRHVLVWAPEGAAEQLTALTTSADRLIVAVDYRASRQPGHHPPAGMASIELLVLGAPEPRSVAASEAIQRARDLPVAALLPEPPAALKSEPAEFDWVLRHPDLPFAQGIARLARRLAGKSVGIAFGVGAARGHAHVAALRALEKLGIHPDLIAGSSVGAGIALLYGQGLPFHEIELIGQRLGPLIRRPRFPIHSLLAASGLDRAFRSTAPPGLRIEDLSLPCAFVATDLMSGKEIVMRRGCAWLSARASATIPGLFPPVRLDGRLLVDGGVVSPVPCRAVRTMGADIVLGISLETRAEDEGTGCGKAAVRDTRRLFPTVHGRSGPTLPAALLRALEIQQRSLSERCLHEADVSLRAFTQPLSLTDFRGGPELLEAGERAVEAAHDQLRALMPWVRA